MDPDFRAAGLQAGLSRTHRPPPRQHRTTLGSSSWSQRLRRKQQCCHGHPTGNKISFDSRGRALEMFRLQNRTHGSRWFWSLCTQVELSASKKAPRLCYKYEQGLYTRVLGLAKPGAGHRAHPAGGWQLLGRSRSGRGRAGCGELRAEQGSAGWPRPGRMPEVATRPHPSPRPQSSSPRLGVGAGASQHRSDSSLYFGNRHIPGAAPRFYERLTECRRAVSCAGSKTAPRGRAGCQHGASPPWHGSASSPKA